MGTTFRNSNIMNSTYPIMKEQIKSVEPSTESQEVKADSGYSLTQVNVGAVSSDIDENITAENIRKGVEILGVQGKFQYPIMGDGTGQYTIKCYDVKTGNILKIDHLNEGEKFTLPNPPIYERLMFAGWTCPIPINDDNTITVRDCDMLCGSNYDTISGNTEIEIELEEAIGKTFTINAYSGEIINWGDGTTDINKTSELVAISHTYNDYGRYIVSISCETSHTINYMLFNQQTYIEPINQAVLGVYLGNYIDNIGNNCFRGLYRLKEITYSSSIRTISSMVYIDNIDTIPQTIVYPKNLITYNGGNGKNKQHILPYGIITCGGYASNPIGIAIIPSSITSWGNNYGGLNFYSNYLTQIILFENITWIKQAGVQYCNFLTKFKPRNKNFQLQNANTFLNSPLLTTIENVNVGGSSGAIFSGCTNISNAKFKNIQNNLQLSNGSWGAKLTQESLLFMIEQLWDMTSSTAKTLTINQVNLDKISNVYVRLIPITDQMRVEDEYIDNKKPFEVCESTDEGAMLITDYVTLKNWSLA